MKRILLVLVISLSILSCKQSKEDLIKKEFKTYVKENFDNPKNFKEVVSVEFEDTLSITEIHKDVKKLYGSYLELFKEDSIRKIRYDEIFESQNLLKLKHKLTKKEAGEIHTVLGKSIEVTKKEIEILKYFDKSEVKTFIDRFKYETPLYAYKIKYREYDDKELKIKEMFAYIDLKSNKVEFLYEPKKVSKELQELDRSITALIEIISFYLETKDIHIEFIKTIDVIQDKHYPKHK